MNESLVELPRTCLATESETQIGECLLSDLSRCEPASALATENLQDHWTLFDYETEDGVKGRLVFAGQTEKLPELRLTLPVAGRYQIRVGVFADDGMGDWKTPCIRLRLAKDPCFTEITTKGKYYWPTVRDTWWRDETLDHDELIISKSANCKGGVAYVRLVPLEMPTPGPETREDEPYLVVTNDSYCAYQSVEEVYEKIFPMRNTAVKKLMFCFAQGDCCYYADTKVGTRFRDLPVEGRSFARGLDREFIKTIARLGSEQDVLQKVCDFTHSLNIEFHASVRMEAFAMHPPFEYFKSSFYENNPQWRCVDYDGRQITRMSYAYPQVQQHMLDLFDEFLRYDIDGLNLIYTRGLPAMLYEDVLVDGFRRKTGLNARELPENHSAYIAYRADVFTEFMREVRSRMNRRCAELGRRPLEISIVCPATAAVNKHYSLDLPRWIEEGLVDFICPDMSLQNLLHDESPENIDLEYYANTVRGTSVGLLPRLPEYHELMPPAGYQQRFIDVMQRVQQQGAAGMMLWDGAHTFNREPNVWERVIHFGKVHSDRLPKSVAFKSLGGFVMDRYPAHMCF